MKNKTNFIVSIIIFGITFVLSVVACITSVLPVRVEGKYTEVSTGPDELYYTFNDGKYEHKWSDDEDNEEGIYKTSHIGMDIIDDDEVEKYINTGNYIYNTSIFYNEPVNDGKRIDQEFTYDAYIDIGENICDIEISLKYHKDGTFERNTSISDLGEEVLDIEATGTYKIEGKVIKMVEESDGETYKIAYIIGDDKMLYYNVYKKRGIN